MVARECLENVTHLYDILEGNVRITEEEKYKYGFRPQWYGSRPNFWISDTRKYVAIKHTNRDYLSKTMLKEMKEFLEKAIELEFYGTVFFRTGYSHGMWASTRASLNEEEQREGQVYLYHAFDVDFKYWEIRNDRNETIIEKNTYREIKPIAKKYLKGEPINE